jgi:Predicted transcriptional regulator
LKETNCKISDAEWNIMRVLWNEAPATAASIIEALSTETAWSPKTIHSLISRLVKKGALKVDKSTAPYRFYPLISKDDCVRAETGAFIRRVFDGSFYHMVANFVSGEEISPREIEKLKQILDEKLKQDEEGDDRLTF